MYFRLCGLSLSLARSASWFGQPRLHLLLRNASSIFLGFFFASDSFIRFLRVLILAAILDAQTYLPRHYWSNYFHPGTSSQAWTVTSEGSGAATVKASRLPTVVQKP
jgi:hypothetical protein